MKLPVGTLVEQQIELLKYARNTGGMQDAVMWLEETLAETAREYDLETDDEDDDEALADALIEAVGVV